MFNINSAIPDRMEIKYIKFESIDRAIYFSIRKKQMSVS